MSQSRLPRRIELLAPARDAECARAALLHGADAVYIGGPAFGARHAAGNSVDDIAALCAEAHLYGARVYVTLNTILCDDELAEAERQVWALYEAGVDALIVQDLALLRLHLPPIALHASTQMDNCTPERAQWLEAAGFRQIVLARELSIDETRRIHEAVPRVPLEAFVHGALCVSYSGRCYASAALFGRSANRGCCAQFCRLAFDLVDERGTVLQQNRHLLSLRDMNRTASLEEMMDAGVSSFKIEGRLKGADYVKNVTAWYRACIDEILSRRAEDYVRASHGASHIDFQPDVSRTFNRQFTDYLLHGRTSAPLFSPYTPKAVGPATATVVRAHRGGIVVRLSSTKTAPIVAGDGLCYVDGQGTLQGFRVNRVADDGTLVPARPLRVEPGTVLHRSLDHAFSQKLAHSTARRTLWLDLTLREVAEGFALDARDEAGASVSVRFDYDHEPARTDPTENFRKQLGRLGDTPFVLRQLSVETDGPRFVPSSLLAEWRREVIARLLAAHRMSYVRDRAGQLNAARLRELTPRQLTFTANVMNAEARAFLTEQGAERVDWAFERERPAGDVVLMTCRHCIRHDLGMCLREHPDRRRLFLRLPDGKKFALRFDCARCEMQVVQEQ